MAARSWRESAAPVIARVLAETKGKPEKEIRAALRDAYPFGPREHWPYKVWLDEIQRQRGLKSQKARHAKWKAAHDAGQVDLFAPQPFAPTPVEEQIEEAERARHAPRT